MITAKEAQKAWDVKAKGTVSLNDTRSIMPVLIAILDRLEKADKPKRKPSAYNKYFAKEASKGKSAQEIAASWKEQKKLPIKG